MGQFIQRCVQVCKSNEEIDIVETDNIGSVNSEIQTVQKFQSPRKFKDEMYSMRSHKRQNSSEEKFFDLSNRNNKKSFEETEIKGVIEELK